MDRAELVSQAAALSELADRRKKLPLYFYEYASLAIQKYHESNALVRVLGGGNRSGKSESAAAELCCAALGYRPYILRQLGLPIPAEPWNRPDDLPPEALMFNGAGIRIQIPCDVYMISGLPLRKGIGEVMHPKIKRLIGPLIEREHMSHGGVPGKVTLKNGSVIHYGSSEMDQMAHEGTNYAFICVDEPIPKRVFTALRRGSIDQFARLTMGFTPIGPFASWVLTTLLAERDKKKVESFTTSIYDNRFLPKEAVEEFANDPTLSELEKQARLYGKFTHLADRIYQQFSADINVIPPFKIPESWFIGMVIDPATVKPWAIAYFAIAPSGDFYFFKEWPDTDITKTRRDTRTVSDYALKIRQMDGDLNVQARLLDPNYGPAKHTVLGVSRDSLQSELARFGFHFDCTIDDALSTGEYKVRQLLGYDETKPISALNRPRLYVTENCPNLINSLLYYSFKLRPGGEDPDETKREERYKDFADCVRYAAVKFADSAFQEEPPSHYDDGLSNSKSYGYGENYASYEDDNVH